MGLMCYCDLYQFARHIQRLHDVLIETYKYQTLKKSCWSQKQYALKMNT
jgi:hypothetical protein